MAEKIKRVETKEWVSTGERILITGYSGLVGFGLVEAARGKDELTGLSRGQTESTFSPEDINTVNADLLDRERLFSAVKESPPTLIVHLAAATDVDRCQGEPEWARQMNVQATRNLVEAVSSLGTPFLHFSTDYVFPRTGGPFSESDTPSVLRSADAEVVNVYGQTKWDAEEIVRQLPQEQRLIVRIASPYDHRYEKKPGTPVVLLKLIKAGRDLKLVGDAKTTYTNGADIAQALNNLILKKAWRDYDVVHVAGPEQLSAVDLVDIDRKYVDSGSRIETTTVGEYFAGKAPRPLGGGLKSEILPKMGIRMRSWEEVLTSELL